MKYITIPLYGNNIIFYFGVNLRRKCKMRGKKSLKQTVKKPFHTFLAQE